MGVAPFLLAQVAADAADRLEWIAWAETVTAAGTLILALIGIGLGVAGFFMLRAASRVLQSLERAVDRLTPQAEPLLERAGRVADDAVEVSRRVRQNIEQANDTVEDLNRQLRQALRHTEERIRRFGAVIDAVQAEVEDVLLDAAASARGVHVAAERLRGQNAPRVPERRGADESNP